MVAITSCCNNDDDASSILTTSPLNININGFENLGNDYVYEGWLIVNGSPISVGTFTVNDNQKLSKTTFEVNSSLLHAATDYVVSVEPKNDPNPEPSEVKILAGKFSGKTAALNADIIADFSSATGNFIIGSYTNPLGTNLIQQESGIWFINVKPGPLGITAGLDLPELGKGWQYEGWVVIDGIPVSTGKFYGPEGSDLSSFYSGPLKGKAFPGEDFIMNAPGNLKFPLSLFGKTAVISVEPFPDNSTKPFVLKPLAAVIKDDGTFSGTLANNIANSFPSGSASR